jgi:hypothetical protein
MPIEYKLENNGTLVMARATGVLSLDDFMSMQEKMKADVNLRDSHDTLLDARSVSQIQISEHNLTVIAQGLASGPRSLGARKLAIVASEEQAFVLGEKYRTVEKGVNESVIVFFHLDVARKWLGLDQ